ncbi:hypothetical protein CDAR_292181 [Caerostris darwini]|uniref:Uncharacterized protein n=1 Tax=Caerostris darwini TaxID=1538125 RepID=A0AAV4V3G9_9ARAC|nr:hypothetical protein CDAR_292181 [Caerostris darwini]
MCCQTAVLIGFLDHDRLCLGNRVTHKRLSKLGQQSPLRQALPQIMLDDLATSRALGLCCCFSSISCFCLGALLRGRLPLSLKICIGESGWKQWIGATIHFDRRS